MHAASAFAMALFFAYGLACILRIDPWVAASLPGDIAAMVVAGLVAVLFEVDR